MRDGAIDAGAIVGLTKQFDGMSASQKLAPDGGNTYRLTYTIEWGKDDWKQFADVVHAVVKLVGGRSAPRKKWQDGEKEPLQKTEYTLSTGGDVHAVATYTPKGMHKVDIKNMRDGA
eukprot:CAMPEP_0198549488 /NCGR_PEP_ID=MMETSP1462-20131121/72907_1 /TAXON_ID=1333877 /ORGANISM="Brandtodinium nutriculum, Strain RCC3387" /LENGTH=116 /DNA_ID=CAMNT_0044280065 /DNA_START=13 /DNA_END=360 /DNA_ORIENTATION=-